MNREYSHLMQAPDGEASPSLRNAFKRVGNMLVEMTKVGVLSWPALQIALTVYTQRVHDVTISPYGVLPSQTPGSSEALTLGASFFLGLPLAYAYIIGIEWDILPPPGSKRSMMEIDTLQ